MLIKLRFLRFSTDIIETSCIEVTHVLLGDVMNNVDIEMHKKNCYPKRGYTSPQEHGEIQSSYEPTAC